MNGAGSQRVLAILSGLVVTMAAGCADLDIMPTWMPFQEPASDHLPGIVSPAERMTQLQELSKQAQGNSPTQRQRISAELAASISKEDDPLIRVEIIRTLGSYPGTAADAILTAALSDTETQVREAACDAWGRRNDAEAVKLLSETLRSDVDTDVRLAAARALGDTKNPDAVAALGEALDDSDPAMQYRAVLSLEKVTGKNLENDVYRWQQYVKGEQPEPTPSLAERLFHWF